MKRLIPVSIIGVFFMVSCALISRSSPTPMATLVPGADVRNGERIYFTSTSSRAGQITYSGGPNFGGMMMGSYLTCAACHGPEGYGGLHQMQMQQMDAPDIRLSALNSMPEMKGKGDYNLEDFKMAVEDGKDPAGGDLNADMPRWQMSEADLNDLFAFIKSLP
jgi:cytochrome c oxidase subunit 2